MRLVFLAFISFILVQSSVAQRKVTDDMSDTEDKLYASTKQINQFFRRFNGEEDEKGNRYYSGDKKYRDATLRKKYLPNLIDAETSSIPSATVDQFIKALVDKNSPAFIDFHSGDWFAEVSSVFNFNGRSETVLLYLRIQPQGQGYEWVIEDVAFDDLKRMFNKDTSANKQFLHPMSHELDFMNLRKALKDNDYPEAFTLDSYEPDYLTLFLYELKKGDLKFETVKQVKFHFFSIQGWYFEVSNFNRPGFNTGWLISNLMAINESTKKQLKDYIYDKL